MTTCKTDVRSDQPISKLKGSIVEENLEGVGSSVVDNVAEGKSTNVIR